MKDDHDYNDGSYDGNEDKDVRIAKTVSLLWLKALGLILIAAALSGVCILIGLYCLPIRPGHDFYGSWGSYYEFIYDPQEWYVTAAKTH